MMMGMESKAKLAGHAIHPMVIVFPLGLLATAVIFDLIYLGNRSPRLADAAYWMIGAGLIGGVVAAATGLIDWWAIPANTRAKAIGLWHAIANVLVMGIFAVSWYMRHNGDTTEPATGLVLLEVGAFALAGVAGWLGGELVGRLGVAVDDGAHLNAPNSLTGRAASEVDTNYTSESAAKPVNKPIGFIPGRTAAGRGATPSVRLSELSPTSGRPTPVDEDRRANVD